MKKLHNKGFTLVELIVVISILIILGTIAFISMQNYTKTSRDSVRISDMSRMKTWLELFQIEAAKYPDPDGTTSITYSGSTVWTQWDFGQIAFQSVDKLDKLPLDPLTEINYGYSVTNTKKEYQLSWVMETDEYTTLNTDTLNAADKEWMLRIIGNYNGEIIKVQASWTTHVLAVPSIITSTWTDLLDIITNDKLAYDGYRNLPSNYSNNGTYKHLWETTSPNLVNSSDFVLYSWDLNDLATDTTKQQALLTKLKNAYTWTDIVADSSISRLANLDPSDATQQESVTRAVIYWSKKSLTSDSISIATTAVTYTWCLATTQDGHAIPQLSHLQTTSHTSTGTVTTESTTMITDTYRCNNGTLEDISSTTSLSCNTGYHDESGVCTSDTKSVPCMTWNNPSNSTETIANVTITWSNGWSTPSNCTWTCNTNYTSDWSKCNWSVPTTGLVAEYLFEDSTDLGKDNTGNHGGTNNWWVTQTTWINWGNAGSFDWVDDHIATNAKWRDLFAPETVTTAMTFSAWINPQNTNLKQVFWDQNGIISILANNTSLVFHRANTPNYTVDLPSWLNHIAISLSSIWAWQTNTIKLYINGKEEYVVTQSNSANDPLIDHWSLFILLGHGVGTWDYWNFQWTIDNARLYKTELSQTEVTQLYAEWLSDPNTELPFVYGTEQPSDHFNTVTRTWTDSKNDITWLNFKPDFVWTKVRNIGYSNALFDSVRWWNKMLRSDDTGSESTTSWWNDELYSFNANWFTLNNNNTQKNYHTNQLWRPYVAWNWKAGWAAVTNTDWIITSQVSVNLTSGFSVIKWTWNGSTWGVTIWHGLNKSPELILTKWLGVGWWMAYHSNTSSTPETNLLWLNSSNAVATWSNTWWQWVKPNSSTFSITNGYNNENYTQWNIAYAFHSVPGYSKIGSYTGNWSSNWPVIDLGFKPAYVLVKWVSWNQDWTVFDTKRDPSNPAIRYLHPSVSQAEWTYSGLEIDFLSNGFQPKWSLNHINTSWWTYIYYAIAE